ncbi:hypothetical protein [Streptomyces sp. NPDC050560]|uniref:hypothetical protein n=1 Tax=Streptomyces sp. NPDC050560 TaxID=3365630 RepID=UPI00378832EB
MSDEYPTGHGTGISEGLVPVRPRPEDRRYSEHVLFRALWIVVAVLFAWLAFGFVREPASWPERWIVVCLACCLAAPMIATSGYRKRLPALDRTPRRATADIVAAESLARFVAGSVWDVYAFEDPAELNHDHRTRVILAETHEDVIRSGYDLGTWALHNEPGPGSDLLRRFADDRRARKAAAS